VCYNPPQTDLATKFDLSKILTILQALEVLKLEEAVARWKSEGIGGKKVKDVIWSGDLQFLSYLMGHAGANSSYPCVTCKM
jgi:hypothetical protein